MTSHFFLLRHHSDALRWVHGPLGSSPLWWDLKSVKWQYVLKHRVTIPCKRSFDFTWNPPDFMKSVWNPLDFMKSIWNPVDFRWNPPKLKSFCWNIWIYKVLGGFHMKSAGFHEIHMKSSGFHEIWQISGEIHPNWRVFAETSEFIRFWVDFMVKSTRFLEICQISGEIHQISWWNLPDFKLWAFVWWSSIGLSTFKRPIRCFSKNSSDWSFEKWKTYTWSSCKSS